MRGLILVLLAPWLVHAEQQYYGTRVTSVVLSGASSQADIRAIPLRIGDAITAENVRQSIQALYDTGRYRYIEVDANPSEGGTSLTFRVKPHFFFSTFRVEPENLLDRSLSGYFRLPLGEKFSETVVDRIAQDTIELLKSQGYFEATIKPEYAFAAPTHLVAVTLRTEPGPKATIANVRIQGGEQTFPKKELADAFGMKSGENFSALSLEKGLAGIRAKFIKLGFLNTLVKVDRNYQTATHSVDLNVTVEPGQFTLVQTRGFDIPKKTLRELVPVFEEGSVDQDLIEEGRVEIDKHMQLRGYFEVTVASEYIEAPKDNAIQINYTITSGSKHRIDSVSIEGNQHFSTEEIKSKIQVRKAQIFNHGLFSRDILDEDVRIVRAMYRNAGFVDVNVRGAYEERDHALEVLILIEEGDRLPVDHIAFLGNEVTPEQELRQDLDLNEGDIYTPVDVDKARSEIIAKYYAKGYADVRVDTNADRIPTNHGMQVTFQINEGEPARIGDILIAGNTITKEKIIHRNSKLYPNAPYNPEDVLQGQQRLYATGLFNRVEIVSLQENVRGVRNLLIQVEDARPILVTYGVGVQDNEGPRGTIEISHNNLFGLDRAISLRVRGSHREQRFQSTFREPRLFNWNVDGFASLFLERAHRKFFDFNRIDFSLQTLKRFSPQQSLLISSSYQTVNLQDIRVNRQAEKIPDERGIIQIARAGASFIQDRRDDPINPSTGSFNTTTLQIASQALGSEVNFVSLFNQSNFYSAAPRGVLASSIRIGWSHPYGGTKKVPITERYFAGGSTTLRAFDLDEVRPAGGNVMTIANLEYRVPLRIVPVKGLGGALFYDTGNVFQDVSSVHLRDFTHTAGFGLRYQTPLGPVRLDVGINLNPKLRRFGPNNELRRDERTQVFFTLGHAF